MALGETSEEIRAIAALAEPVRARLYDYVSGQPDAVGRDRAARAVGISRALAAFHLDRLVDQGLLVAEYRRLSGRTGPGAGRPAKLYRRAPREIDVSLPPRRYEFAARVLVSALEQLSAGARGKALRRAAEDAGEKLAEEARAAAGVTAPGGDFRETATRLLDAYGFEPYAGPDGEIILRNCPFDAIAGEHADLVCAMNLALLNGMARGLGRAGIAAQVDRAPGMCCVTLRAD